MNEEDINQTINILYDILTYEFESNRIRIKKSGLLHPYGRMNHIIAQMRFKLKNPNYERQIKTE